MKEVFLKNSVNFIAKYNKNYTSDDIEKIKYGLEGIYLTITKLIVILMLAIALKITKKILLVLIFFNIIRFPAFGVHANKSSVCLITSILFIIGLSYLIFNVNIPINARIIICFACFIHYLVFAPADTPKRPLTNAKKRKYRKLASCILSLIYITIIFVLKNEILVNSIFSALIIEAIMISPITYKMLGIKYNNYKKC